MKNKFMCWLNQRQGKGKKAAAGIFSGFELGWVGDMMLCVNNFVNCLVGRAAGILVIKYALKTQRLNIVARRLWFWALEKVNQSDRLFLLVVKKFSQKSFTRSFVVSIF